MEMFKDYWDLAITEYKMEFEFFLKYWWVYLIVFIVWIVFIALKDRK